MYNMKHTYANTFIRYIQIMQKWYDSQTCRDWFIDRETQTTGNIDNTNTNSRLDRERERQRHIWRLNWKRTGDREAKEKHNCSYTRLLERKVEKKEKKKCEPPSNSFMLSSKLDFNNVFWMNWIYSENELQPTCFLLARRCKLCQEEMKRKQRKYFSFRVQIDCSRLLCGQHRGFWVKV